MIDNIKNVTQQVVKVILNNPRARERKHRNQVVAAVLIRKYGLQIDQKTLAAIIRDAENGTRAWRGFLQDNPQYRGTDYKEKTALEQDKMLQLGYVPGYAEQLKILERFN